MRNGSRNTLASVFGAALATGCLEQKRSFHSVGFNGRVTHRSHIDKDGSAGSWDGARMSPVAIINRILRRSCRGGTSFDAPLLEAIKMMGANKNADVILLTDGHAEVSDEVLEKLKSSKEDTGLRVFTLLVGGAQLNAVSAISDGVFNAENLNDEKSFKELATLMKSALSR